MSPKAAAWGLGSSSWNTPDVGDCEAGRREGQLLRLGKGTEKIEGDASVGVEQPGHSGLRAMLNEDPGFSSR